jgi:hypothetical protein
LTGSERSAYFADVSDQARIQTLKTSPHLVKQHGGCCGFAATLMGLLVHNPKELDALYNTLAVSKSYRGILQSSKVSLRVQKRILAGFIEPTAPNYLDGRLSIALMILLKEYLKETGKKDIWEGCIEYSKKVSGWQYGDKLKNLQNIEDAPKLFGFSYKHGDLALTAYALQWLLVMVGFEAVEGRSLISNEDVDGYKSDLLPIQSHGDLQDGLREVLAWINRGVYAGGVLGVTRAGFINPAQEPYEYISHWVYLPKQKQQLGDVWDAVTWTWGEEWTLKDLLVKHDRHYAPKAVIVFKKSGRGMMFV